MHRLAARLQRHTSGNPLFVINVLDDLVARGLLIQQDGRWSMNSELNEIQLGIPMTFA
jgi:predicted ATPase